MEVERAGTNSHYDHEQRLLQETTHSKCHTAYITLCVNNCWPCLTECCIDCWLEFFRKRSSFRFWRLRVGVITVGVFALWIYKWIRGVRAFNIDSSLQQTWWWKSTRERERERERERNDVSARFLQFDPKAFELKMIKLRKIFAGK